MVIRKAKSNIYLAAIVSLDTEALGGVQTRAFWKRCVFRW